MDVSLKTSQLLRYKQLSHGEVVFSHEEVLLYCISKELIPTIYRLLKEDGQDIRGFFRPGRCFSVSRLQHRYRSVSEWYRCLIRMWVRGCLQRCLGGLAIPAPSLLSAERSITAQVQLRVCRPKSGVFNSRSSWTRIIPQCSAFSGAEPKTAQVYTTRDRNALCIRPACLQKQSYTRSVTLRIVQVEQTE